MISTWVNEIQATGQRRIFAARIYMDVARNEWTLPADTPQRPAFAALLRSEHVVVQLPNAYALTVNLDRGSARASFILLNMARAGDWLGLEASLLAHEIGHVWLHAGGKPGSAVSDGCVGVHAADIVQHVLIRTETARRGVPLEPYLQRTFQIAYDAMKSGPLKPAAPDVCQEAAALSLLSDVRASNWALRNDFEARIGERFPDLPRVIDTLAGVLQEDRIQTTTGYGNAVLQVRSLLDGVLRITR